MSEYQYYEFLAVDRPLTAAEQAEVRQLSARARITAGLSPAQLARDSFVTPQSTADLVANLERRTLVRRDRNPDNRRELVVSLTASGHKLLAEYAAVVAALEQDMTAELDRSGVEVSALTSAHAGLP
jgi:DNA-binding MarR family transcriptional regulator